VKPGSHRKGSWCRECYNWRRRFHGKLSIEAMRDLAISIPTAPTKNPDDSVALALLNLPNKTIKRGVLVPRWSQLALNLPSVETGRSCAVGHEFAFLFSGGHELRKTSCQVRVTFWAPGYPKSELRQFDSGNRLQSGVRVPPVFSSMSIY
jgi:hypothetical protein